MTKDIFRKKYTQHKSNATQRGIPFLIPFEEWKLLWVTSGKWEQRGRGASKYCMSRYGDLGAYEIGNVFISTNSVNIKDGNIGKTVSFETRAKISQFQTGTLKPWVAGEKNPMHRPEVKAAMSAATGGINHYNQKGVNTSMGYFVTAKEAALALNISKSTIEWRSKHNKSGFSRPLLAIA
jgi:hypothetical protein